MEEQVVKIYCTPDPHPDMDINELGEEFARFFRITSPPMPASHQWAPSLGRPCPSSASVAAAAAAPVPLLYHSRVATENNRATARKRGIRKSALLRPWSHRVPKRVRFDDARNVVHWIPRHQEWPVVM